MSGLMNKLVSLLLVMTLMVSVSEASESVAGQSKSHGGFAVNKFDDRQGIKRPSMQKGGAENIQKSVQDESRIRRGQYQKVNQSEVDVLKSSKNKALVSDNAKFFYDPLILIDDADVLLRTDSDEDGYYHQFDVAFLMSIDAGESDLYARLYVRNGQQSWHHIYTTDYFTLNVDDGPREYQIETKLTSGYVSGYYDVKIELYDRWNDELVALSGPDEDGDLINLALESLDYETQVAFHFDLFSIDTTLRYDDDHDGFYSQYEVTLDIDTADGHADLYAEVYLRGQSQGGWVYEHTTDVFSIHGLSSSDHYTFSADLLTGYDADYYDVLIEVYDANSQLHVLSIGSETNALSGLALEDQELDGVIYETYESSTAVDTEYGGAGQWDLRLLFILAVILLRHRKRHVRQG